VWQQFQENDQRQQAAFNVSLRFFFWGYLGFCG
jgi:hypothetical protein